MFTVHLGVVVLGIYFIFSLVALIWGLVRLSTSRHNDDMNAFYTGLVMFILGTWKGMTISMLHQLLGTCKPLPPMDEDKNDEETPPAIPPSPVNSSPSTKTRRSNAIPVITCP